MLIGIIIAIAAAILLLGSTAAGWAGHKKRNLRTSFGPEYETVVQEHDTKQDVDQELLRRKRLYDRLNLHAISVDDQEYYSTVWGRLQTGSDTRTPTSLDRSRVHQRCARIERDSRGVGTPQNAMPVAASVDHDRSASALSVRSFAASMRLRRLSATANPRPSAITMMATIHRKCTARPIKPKNKATASTTSMTASGPFFCSSNRASRSLRRDSEPERGDGTGCEETLGAGVSPFTTVSQRYSAPGRRASLSKSFRSGLTRRPPFPLR